jgi:hypothetical protein
MTWTVTCSSSVTFPVSSNHGWRAPFCRETCKGWKMVAGSPCLVSIAIFFTTSPTSLFTLFFSSARTDPSRRDGSRRKAKASRDRALKPAHPLRLSPCAVGKHSVPSPLLSPPETHSLSSVFHVWIFLAAFPTARSVAPPHNWAPRTASRSVEAPAWIGSWIDPVVATAAGSDQVTPPRIHALLLSIPMRISPSYSWEFGWGRRICRIGFRVYGLIAVSPLTERNVYWFVSLSFCRSIWGISSPNWMNVLWIELSNSVMESGFPRLSRIFNSASTESLIGSIFLCLLALLGHVFFFFNKLCLAHFKFYIFWSVPSNFYQLESETRLFDCTYVVGSCILTLLLLHSTQIQYTKN